MRMWKPIKTNFQFRKDIWKFYFLSLFLRARNEVRKENRHFSFRSQTLKFKWWKHIDWLLIRVKVKTLSSISRWWMSNKHYLKLYLVQKRTLARDNLKPRLDTVVNLSILKGLLHKSGQFFKCTAFPTTSISPMCWPF